MTNKFAEISPQLKKRYGFETRFREAGRIAIFVSLGFLILMVGSIAYRSIDAFSQTYIGLDIDISKHDIEVEDFANARFEPILKETLRDLFPDVTNRREKRKLYGILSSGAGFELRDTLIEQPALLEGTHRYWVKASDDIDLLEKGGVDLTLDPSLRRITDQEASWMTKLNEMGAVERRFNWDFFFSGDSREPELAGILSAFMGSLFSLTVCFVLSFPIGILAAVYLEEFAPKNKMSDFIEININNLAAVPSIVFGLLGLAILLNAFDLPRSSSLVGGIVLALMTLPTIIIASRAALRAVPPSIREAALGLGASPVQTVFQHVIPLALPGMFTGAIIGMARALGETAPLLMIGMVAFIVDVPTSILEPATALPVQIFLWADAPQRAFVAKASAAIMVLLFFLVLMNLTAIYLRKKFEIRY